MKTFVLILIGTLAFNNLTFGQSQILSGGNNFSVALCEGGFIYAWGSNSSGQIGAISAGTAYPGTDYTTPQPVYLPAGLTFAQVNGGSGTTALALTCYGNVYAWGENKCGQVGLGAVSSATTTTCGAAGAAAGSIPVGVPNQVVGGVQGGTYLKKIKFISGGNNFSIAVDSTGLVYTWGENDNGSLGDGTTTLSNSPVLVQKCYGGNLTNIVQAQGGDETGYALDASGHVWSWGLNDNKNLGNGTAFAYSTCASQVVKDASGTPLSNIKMIAAGDTHGMALDSSGQVWTWGGDWAPGQLGQGTTYVFNVYASRVVAANNFTATGTTGPYITNAIYIAAGQASSAVVLSDGSVVTFGGLGLYSQYCAAGQSLFSGTLGNGAPSTNMTCQSNAPTCTGNSSPNSCSGYGTPVYVKTNVVTNLSNIVSVARGDAWYFATDNTGNTYTWGFNGAGGGMIGGQLGIGNTIDQPYALKLSLPLSCGSFQSNSPNSPCSNAVTTQTLAAISNDDIQISPNPSDQFTELLFKGIYADVTVKIYNALGQQLFENEIGSVNYSSKKLLFNNMSSGIYLIEVNTNKGNVVKRFIKE